MKLIKDEIGDFILELKKEQMKRRCMRVVTHDRIDIASMPPAPNNDDWYRKEKARLEQEKENTK